MTKIVSSQAIREAVLRRVCGAPCRSHLVLRGGMRTALLCPLSKRVVEDVDFLSLQPFSLEETAHGLQEALLLPQGDGVVFGKTSAQVIWGDTPFPGVRVQVEAQAVQPVQVVQAVQIDVGFGDPLLPPAEWLPYPLQKGDQVELLQCRAESLLSWKVHGLFERGTGQWRPKDLYDLYLLLTQAALDHSVLPESLAAAFSSRGTPLSVAERFLHGPFGASKGSQGKWLRFRRASNNESIPERVRGVVVLVAEALRPHFLALGV